MSLPTALEKTNAQAIKPPHDGYTVITLENVTVRYKVAKEQVRTFKEYAIRRIQGRIQEDEFLALKDINLNVEKGEVFGLIGANGAGKTTLLRLVARVMRPSQGRVRVVGSVAPLLAMGAGFHNELTGRENVYLNGAMLGFTKEEMDEKFSRIVDFAEIWDFIDAPLRTYSSGMMARLGFAVATDSMPDILIVDEVLSVGDSAFQEKSYNRIQSFQNNGATTLLVTHGMETVKKMCTRVAWLDSGEIRQIGNPGEVVDAYHKPS